MKILKYKVAGALYQQETGPQAQVGDQVKMFLDTEANPELPEFVFGIIQPGITKSGCCEDYTTYPILYDESELGSGFLRPDDVLSIETTAAVDVVAEDLQDEVERATAAEGVLTTNLADEVAARIAADLLKAPLASPTFTGDPKAPTPATSDSDTSVATTAFVQAQPVVRYTAQSLTVPQQLQTQTNVGITHVSFSTYELTDASGDVAMNWDTRVLSDTSGTPVFAWSSNLMELVDGVNLGLGETAGSQIGRSTLEKLSFHGSAAVVQRSGAAQIAVPTTVLTVSNPPTQAEVQAVIDRLALVTTLDNEIRATLVEKGLMKGSA